MSRWIIGDIHGCFDEMQALLDLIQINKEKDTVYLLGDLINRGPKSLEVLEFVMNNASYVKTILGNHDIHLIAQYFHKGIKKSSPELDKILHSKNIDNIIHWLRHQPFTINIENNILVHAGIHPSFSDENIELYNRELSRFSKVKT